MFAALSMGRRCDDLSEQVPRSPESAAHYVFPFNIVLLHERLISVLFPHAVTGRYMQRAITAMTAKKRRQRYVSPKSIQSPARFCKAAHEASDEDSHHFSYHRNTCVMHTSEQSFVGQAGVHHWPQHVTTCLLWNRFSKNARREVQILVYVAA